MSLAEDFSMYYGGSYVGIKRGDDVLPFLVNEVYTDSDIYSNTGDSEQDYSEEAEDALVFRGEIVQNNGDTRSARISYRDEDLILELPDPKYIKIRRGFIWVTFRPSRSTKKGLTNRKVSGISNLTNEVLRKIFSKEEPEEVMFGCYLKRSGKLYYKGMEIGTFEGDNYTICKEATFHAKVLSGRLEGCQIHVTE